MSVGLRFFCKSAGCGRNVVLLGSGLALLLLQRRMGQERCAGQISRGPSYAHVGISPARRKPPAPTISVSSSLRDSHTGNLAHERIWRIGAPPVELGSTPSPQSRRFHSRTVLVTWP